MNTQHRRTRIEDSHAADMMRLHIHMDSLGPHGRASVGILKHFERMSKGYRGLLLEHARANAKKQRGEAVKYVSELNCVKAVRRGELMYVLPRHPKKTSQFLRLMGSALTKMK